MAMVNDYSMQPVTKSNKNLAVDKSTYCAIVEMLQEKFLAHMARPTSLLMYRVRW